MTLTTLSRDRVLFPKLLSEAREIATRGQEGKVVVYTAWNAEWKPFGPPRRKRELKSVVLGDGVSKRIEDDVKGFLKRGQWYAERGARTSGQRWRYVLICISRSYFRYPLSKGLSPSRPAGEWKDIIYSGLGRKPIL